MKLRIILAILIASLLLNSCEKDDSGDSGNAAGKLYVRSLYSLVTGSVSIDWYYMDDNGEFVKNPKNGVQPVDMVAEKKNNQQNTGTYTIYKENNNSYIKITWASGSTTTMGLKYQNGDISEMDIMGIMIRQTGLPKNYKLNAAYEGANTDMYFRFNTDGTFTFKDYDLETYKWETYTGKYEINGNNLNLKFDEGTVLLCMIAVLDNGDLIINREYYEKQ